MIYHNPPMNVLGRAEVITLFDLGVPSWKEVVVGRQPGFKVGSMDLDVINIPVDSTDAAVLQKWRDAIERARS